MPLLRSPHRFRRPVFRAFAVVVAMRAVAFAPEPLHAQTLPAGSARIDALERSITADPENLKLAADYRQLMIAAGTFDRSIDLFEQLAKAKEAGPHVQISLA